MVIRCGIMRVQFNIISFLCPQICLGVYKISRLNLRFFIDFCGGAWYNIVVNPIGLAKGDECPITTIPSRWIY